jgi:hypothetical protein
MACVLGACCSRNWATGAILAFSSQNVTTIPRQTANPESSDTSCKAIKSSPGNTRKPLTLPTSRECPLWQSPIMGTSSLPAPLETPAPSPSPVIDAAGRRASILAGRPATRRLSIGHRAQWVARVARPRGATALALAAREHDGITSQDRAPAPNSSQCRTSAAQATALDAASP